MSQTDLIVSDIEGCLMPANSSAADLKNLSLIRTYCNLAKHNSDLPRLVACTGRSAPFVAAIIQVINSFFPDFPSIIENGAYLFDPVENKIITHPLLTAKVLNAMQKVQKQLKHFLNGEQAKKEPGKEICISLNPVGNKSIEQFYEEVETCLVDWSDVIEVTRSKSAVDITPKGINKAAGVRFLAEYTNIEPTQMLGIGDTRGDLLMLELVGMPTCPQNAEKEVKNTAKFIASKPETEGVVEILRQFTSWR